ncbi:hypothetical protein ACFO0M_27415 [Micromonospora mangrovi]|uniref:Peptidoglycan-binding protein n=2 Tax=Micromonospora TaxID=1873 RepID=A0AAU7MG92_9ACTN
MPNAARPYAALVTAMVLLAVTACGDRGGTSVAAPAGAAGSQPAAAGPRAGTASPPAAGEGTSGLGRAPVTSTSPTRAGATAGSRYLPVPASRSKLTWPFAAGSIWNTPIGSGARYVPVRIGSKGLGTDEDWFVVTSARDPQVPTYRYASFTKGRCTGSIPQPQAQWHPELGRPVRVPKDLVIPDATTTPYATPNNSSAFLDPDGRTLHQFNVTARCRPGAPLYGYRVAKQDIYGDGINGGHLGSGLSSIGGSIREGELTGDGPIRHALKVDLWGNWLYHDRATGGFRWPASLADSVAPTDYKGRSKALRMGSLLAIRPDVTPEQLKITDPVALKIFHALQDFGAYVVDTTGWDYNTLCVEMSAKTEFQRRHGTDISRYRPLQDAVNRMLGVIQVVDNNSPGTIGGGGTRRAPAAPPIRD